MARNSKRRRKNAGQQVKKSLVHSMPSIKGRLFIIGGREDRGGERKILREVAGAVGTGKLVVATLASGYADQQWRAYEGIFKELGAGEVLHLSIEGRDEKAEDAHLELMEGADGIFFTGGDQLKITTKLGGTRLSDYIEKMFKQGGVIAGTSAGAAAMSEMMLIPGTNTNRHKERGAFQMVPGLGLLKNAIIDQHFSERGRIRRLLGAVSQNPRMIGIGIDEDTAIVVKGNSEFRVLGSASVYVADGRGLTYTNIADQTLDQNLSVFNIRLHILSDGDIYDLRTHQPRAN
jgi:cyanophycinase